MGRLQQHRQTAVQASKCLRSDITHGKESVPFWHVTSDFLGHVFLSNLLDADRDRMRQVLVVTGSTRGSRLLPENNLDFTTANLFQLSKIQSAKQNLIS